MRFVTIAVLFILTIGCSHQSIKPEAKNKALLSTELQGGSDKATAGLTGNAALEFLKRKKVTMSERINPHNAEKKLTDTTAELRDYKTNSNVVAAATMVVGGVVAAAADYAVAGGVVTAILGGYGLYNEDQRKDIDKTDLIASCRTVMKAGADVIDRYVDKWEIVFLKYNSNTVPDAEIIYFNIDTDNTNTKISDLIGTCI